MIVSSIITPEHNGRSRIRLSYLDHHKAGSDSLFSSLKDAFEYYPKPGFEVERVIGDKGLYKCSKCGSFTIVDKLALMNGGRRSGRYSCPVCFAELSDDIHKESGGFDATWNDLLRRMEKEIESEIEKAIKTGQLNDYAMMAEGIDPEKISSSPELLTDYFNQALELEIALYEMSERLRRLERKKAKAEDEGRFSAFCQYVEVNKKYYEEFETILYPRWNEGLEEPIKPIEPYIHNKGLLDVLLFASSDNAERAKYQTDLAKYEQDLRKYESEKAARAANRKALINKMEQTENIRTTAERAMESKIRETTSSLTIKLIESEIEEVKGKVTELSSLLKTFYSANVIYEKYRNLVAVATITEYLRSGRCDCLQGPNGAYNLYETESRTNVIITKLNQVVDMLSDIRDVQFLLVHELEKINDTLQSMDNKLASALNEIEHIRDNSDYSLSQLEEIAYHTKMSEYYSQRTSGLINAMGYLVAIK